VIKEGKLMLMAGIRDRTLEFSFLLMSIASKLPFSSSKMGKMKQLWYKLFDESTLDPMIKFSTYECERKANIDETKIVVSSIEDKIDFSTSVLGPNITVHESIQQKA
jgi:hypothetical protein